eukprot:3979118-Prymnesium_polylepis.1
MAPLMSTVNCCGPSTVSVALPSATDATPLWLGTTTAVVSAAPSSLVTSTCEQASERDSSAL